MLKKILKPFLSILIIPTLLVIIWFKSGNILGHGESGLPFYDLQLQFDVFGDSWSNYTLGMPTGAIQASIPFYWLFSKLQGVGIPGYLLQAFFFWALLVISGASIYFLARELFPKLKNKYLILVVFYYWFNPFCLVNVYNRFLNNFIVFYALLPLLLFLFIKGIRTKKYIYAVLVCLAAAIFSYAFTSMVFIVILWFLLFYTAVYYMFVSRKWKERFYIAKFLMLTLTLFTLVNLWWISLSFSYIFSSSFFTTGVSSFLDNVGNSQTLSILSKALGDINNLIRLRHGSFFGLDGLFWLQIYNFLPITLLGFAAFGVILFALIRNRKNSSVLYLFLLLLFSLFFAKGNNLPFGEIFEYFFIKYTFLQAFRNPFEKILFLAPVAASPLFALGLANLLETVSAYKRRLIYAFSFLWLLVVWGFPFWTSFVFNSGELYNTSVNGFEVKVPQYYKQAAEWLNSRNGNFRLMVLPIGDEGITYTWEKGYSGIELSNQLLPVPSVSFNTTIPYYNTLVRDLESYLFLGYDITDIMSVVNARYIMFRHDIDWIDRQMKNPQMILDMLVEEENKGRIKKVAEFGNISFWEDLGWRDKTIYPSGSGMMILPQARIKDNLFLPNPSSVILSDSGNSELETKSFGVVVHPDAKFIMDYYKKPVYEIRQDIFPSVKYLPSSKFYNLVILKEYLETSLIKDRFALLDREVVMLGKRLVEAKMESDKGNDQAVITSISKYKDSLKQAESHIDGVNKKLFGRTQVYKQEELYDIFSRHEVVLVDIKNKFIGNALVTDVVNDAIDLVSRLQVGLKITPAFGYVNKEEFPIDKRVVYQFNIKSPGEYKLFWGDNSLRKYYEINESGLPIQINSIVSDTKLEEEENGLISLGKYDLESGINEVGLNTPKEINLLNITQEIHSTVNHGEEVRSFPIENFDSYGTYILSFDYLIKKGSGIKLSVVTNNTRPNEVKGKSNNSKWIFSLKKTLYLMVGKNFTGKTETEPTLSRMIEPDLINYDFTEKRYYYMFGVPQNSDSGSIVFKMTPWNDCESIFYTQKERCNDPDFRKPYDKTTEVVIKNITLFKTFADEPILVKQDLAENVLPLPEINYKKVNNTNYLLNIRNATEPFLLVFSTLFDDGWRLYNQNKEISEDSHFLANLYANGWLIDKKGDFSLELKYAPQDVQSITRRISLAVFILGTAFVVIVFLKEKRNENP